MVGDRDIFVARSYLFVPGNNQQLLEKIGVSLAADAIVIDLEDAVPLEQKTLARQLVSATLQQEGFNQQRPVPVYVRVNSGAEKELELDLATLPYNKLKGVRLAKCESAEEITRALGLMQNAETGHAAKNIDLVPTIESARGLLAAHAIAQAPQVTALAFGRADFVRDTNLEVEESELQLAYAYSQLVFASRAAGIHPPIASVYTDLSDLAGLRRNTEALKRFGFFGRSCIHPAQVDVINEVFSPTAEQIAQAREIVAAFDEAASKGLGVTKLANGEFIDRPIVERALATLALHQRIASQ